MVLPGNSGKKFQECQKALVEPSTCVQCNQDNGEQMTVLQVLPVIAQPSARFRDEESSGDTHANEDNDARKVSANVS